MILALDALLAGAGVAMIAAYLTSSASADSTTATADAGAVAEIEVLPPRPLRSDDAEVTLSVTGGQTAGSGAGAGSGDVVKQGSGKGSGKGSGPAKPPTPSKPDAAVASARPDAAPSAPPTPKPADAGTPTAPPGADAAIPAASGSDAGAPAKPSEPTEEEIAKMSRLVHVTVQKHQAQLSRCYERASKTTGPDNPLKGRIDVRFQIMPSGSANSVRVRSNSTGSKQLAQCVAGLVKSWEFPSGASGPLHFEWPFVFKAPQ